MLVIAAAAGIGVLTVFEYRPEDKEDIELIGTADKTLSTGDSFTVLTWNTGYGALSDDSDFFMDGGTMYILLIRTGYKRILNRWL